MQGLLAFVPKHGARDMRASVSSIAAQVALVALVYGCSACTYHVYSPPARNLPLETPATLAPATIAAAAELGWGASVFGVDPLTASVRVRRGMVEGLDGMVEANFVRVPGTSDTETDEHPNIYSLRVGAKYQFQRHFAAMVGVGGGGSAGGGFVSPDLGFVFGYENRYVIPFVSARGFVSLPIAARAVYLGTDDGDAQYSAPAFTFGFALTSGVRVPLRHEAALTHALSLGVTLTEVIDARSREGYFGPSAGVELVF